MSASAVVLVSGPASRASPPPCTSTWRWKYARPCGGAPHLVQRRGPAVAYSGSLLHMARCDPKRGTRVARARPQRKRKRAPVEQGETPSTPLRRRARARLRPPHLVRADRVGPALELLVARGGRDPHARVVRPERRRLLIVVERVEVHADDLVRLAEPVPRAVVARAHVDRAAVRLDRRVRVLELDERARARARARASRVGERSASRWERRARARWRASVSERRRERGQARAARARARAGPARARAPRGPSTSTRTGSGGRASPRAGSRRALVLRLERVVVAEDAARSGRYLPWRNATCASLSSASPPSRARSSRCRAPRRHGSRAATPRSPPARARAASR